jgi:hypothetical protein
MRRDNKREVDDRVRAIACGAANTLVLAALALSPSAAFAAGANDVIYTAVNNPLGINPCLSG